MSEVSNSRKRAADDSQAARVSERGGLNLPLANTMHDGTLLCALGQSADVPCKTAHAAATTLDLETEYCWQ